MDLLVLLFIALVVAALVWYFMKGMKPDRGTQLRKLKEWEAIELKKLHSREAGPEAEREFLMKEVALYNAANPKDQIDPDIAAYGARENLIY